MKLWSAWWHPSEMLLIVSNHLKIEMMNSYASNVSVLPASTPMQIEGSYSDSMCLNATIFLHVLKVACVGTSQSMFSLEMNKASLKTSITKETEWFCITISAERIRLCNLWKPPINSVWAPYWAPTLQADHCLTAPWQPANFFSLSLTITKIP